MKAAAIAAAAIGLTVCLTGALLAVRPFDKANQALDWMFGAPPAWTQVKNLVRDERIQELSRGERPLASFRALRKHWEGRTGRRVCFIGNSQMLAVSLAASEERSEETEPTYVDRLALDGDKLGLLVYRLSAPGMSYPEALWYVHYLLLEERIRPDEVVLQINYQAFWNAGIRGGMLEMLEQDRFREVIEREAAGNAAYAETFREALRTWKQMREKKPETAAADARVGERVEAATRKRLGELFPRFAERRTHKDDLLEMLYRLRVYVLQLKPSTARTITGTRWERSRAAVEAIVEACREKQVKVLLFHAPLNPKVKLYRSERDRQNYREFVETVAGREGVQLVDLEHAVPAQYWGRWMNGPDPLHLGRKGHKLMAARFIGLLGGNR
ncbi:MAG: SGNH/GDSL hydrolase family protein [Bryobacteraceae bacterium]